MTVRALSYVPLTLLMLGGCPRPRDPVEPPTSTEQSLYSPAASALGGYASIPWRAAVGRIDDWDDDLDLVVAAGGDMYPQNLFAVGGCEPKSSAPPFRGLRGLTGLPTRHPGRTWVSPLYAFYTQVRVADVLADPGDEVIAGVRGTALPLVDGMKLTGGVLAMSLPDLDDQQPCTQPGVTTGQASEVHRLVCGAQVNDFVLTDIDNDGDQDIVAALAAWDPESESCHSLQVESLSEKLKALPDAIKPETLSIAPIDGPAAASCPDPDPAPPGRKAMWRPLGSERTDRLIGVFVNDGHGGFTPLGGLYPYPEWLQGTHPAEPSRVAVVDINGDGHVDIVGAFQASLIVVATGPFSADPVEADCTDDLRIEQPRSIACVATERFVSDLDVAVVARDTTEAVIIGTTGCWPGHVLGTCCGSGRLEAWWPTSGRRDVLHETKSRGVLVSTASVVQLSDDQGTADMSVVFGLATDPRESCSADSLYRVGLDPAAEPVTPLHGDDLLAPRLPADILPVRGQMHFDHEVAVPAMQGARSRVTLPGAGPVEPVAVVWKGKPQPMCRVESGIGDACWSWDEAARAILVPSHAATDAKVTYRNWRRPLVIAVDANAMQGLRFYSAAK